MKFCVEFERVLVLDMLWKLLLGILVGGFVGGVFWDGGGGGDDGGLLKLLLFLLR